MDEVGKTIARPFLLMEGGPLFNIQKRVGLIKHNAPFLKRRAVLAALVTWLPLLILSAIQGRAFGHSVPVPFIRDFSVYTRFLLGIPLLLLAENILGPHLAEAAAHFVTSGVVIEKDYQRFDQIIDRGLRARNSILAEVFLVILAYVGSSLAFRATAIPVSTWYATHTESGEPLTWAGLWLKWFCIPLFQFLILRWLWRLFLWFQFLGRVRKLDMQLFPTHPDQAAGLGFVGDAQRFFGIILFAFSLSSTGVMARDIVLRQADLVILPPVNCRLCGLRPLHRARSPCSLYRNADQDKAHRTSAIWSAGDNLYRLLSQKTDPAPESGARANAGHKRYPVTG